MTPKERMIWSIKNRPMPMLLNFVIYPLTIALSASLVGNYRGTGIDMIIAILVVIVLIKWTESTTNEIYEHPTPD